MRWWNKTCFFNSPCHDDDLSVNPREQGNHLLVTGIRYEIPDVIFYMNWFDITPNIPATVKSMLSDRNFRDRQSLILCHTRTSNLITLCRICHAWSSKNMKQTRNMSQICHKLNETHQHLQNIMFSTLALQVSEILRNYPGKRREWEDNVRWCWWWYWGWYWGW